MADIKSLSDADLLRILGPDQSQSKDITSLSNEDVLKLAGLPAGNAPGAAEGTNVTADNVVRSIAHGVPVIGGLADKFAAGADALVGPAVDQLAAKFGFSDNASGTSRKADFSDRYHENLAREQAQSGTYAAQHPVANTAGEIGGGLAGGVAALPSAPLLSVPSIAANAGLAGADALTRTGDTGQALTAASVGAAVPAALGIGGAIISRVLPLATALTSGMSPAEQLLARQAGREGGAAGRTFWQNMRAPDQEALIGEARQGIAAMRQDMQQAYTNNRALWQNEQNLPFAPIINEVQNAFGRAVSPSGVVIDEAASRALQNVSDKVGQFVQANGARGNALEMDGLKRSIGAIRDNLPLGSNARGAVSNVYGAVRDIIANHAPHYEASMRSYGQAANLLDEVTRALSLGQNAQASTTMRKLLSTLRDGYAGAHGARGNALAALSQHAPNLPYAIAGQSANQIMPRGLVARLGELGTLGAGVAGGLSGALHVAPALAAASPRVVGMTNYGIGAAQRIAGQAPLAGLNAAQNTILRGIAPTQPQQPDNGNGPPMYLFGQPIYSK